MRRYDHLGDVEVFLATVDAGSLTGAAAALGTTPSMVSRALGRLEQRLGAQLLRRTTRRLGLTDAGHLYLAQARAAFALIDEAGRAVQPDGGMLAGTVRLSAPTTWGHYRLPARLQAFAARHPQVQVELDISNRNADLVADGFDLVIRGGEPRDSGLVAHRLEEAAYCLVASPAYLDRHGTPAQVAELAGHACLSFLLPSTGRALPWQLREDGQDVDRQPHSHLRVTDDVLGVVSLARAGLGICQTFDFVAREHLASGELVEVLAHARGRTRPFSLLYAPHRRLSAASRALIETLRTAP
jgi:DNA-binding transcriptional LysR family regulator